MSALLDRDATAEVRAICHGLAEAEPVSSVASVSGQSYPCLNDHTGALSILGDGVPEYLRSDSCKMLTFMNLWIQNPVGKGLIYQGLIDLPIYRKS